MGCINPKKSIVIGKVDLKYINEIDENGPLRMGSKVFDNNKCKHKQTLQENENNKILPLGQQSSGPEIYVSANHKNLETQSSHKKMSNFVIRERDKILLRQILSTHFLFKDKSPQIINKLIDKLEVRELAPNEILFREGEPGDCFYILKDGILELSTEGGSKRLIPMDTFGELALIEKKKRTATVIAIEACALYVLNGALFRETVMKISEAELKDRLVFLTLVPMFNGLSTVQINNLASSMVKGEFAECQYIIKEGDLGDSIYIIREGVVGCLKGNTEVRQLTIKDYFGEYATLFGNRRSHSIVAKEKATCYQVCNADLIENLGKNYKNIILQSIVKEAFQKSRYMKTLASDNYFLKIFSLNQLKNYEDDDTVFSKNDTKKKFIILIEGNLFNSKKNEHMASRGELFGDHLIKSNEIVKYDIIARSDCITLEFDWDNVVKILNLNVEKKKVLSFLNQVSQMKKIQIFSHTSQQRLLEICKNMKKVKFEPDEVIINEGEMGDMLFLIKKGKVNVVKDGKFTRQLEEGNCFGEVSLLINEARSATIIASTHVTTFTLTKDDFISFIDKNMFEYLVKKISLQDNFNFTLTDLFFCKGLGHGKFGMVCLVHNSKNLYAIKAVNRKSAEKQKILIKYFIEERNILLTLDHPFIMKLVKTFKNEDYIFYLMEYVCGMGLNKFLENRFENKIRNVQDTQFYISILFIILDYLNSKSLCHRDLKPDNIMIDEKGYLKLLDFGTAIVVKNFTSTVTGTPHYIAPEVLTGKGYSFSCDYWSIGIIAFEIFFNYFPFGQNATDPMDVYREVLKKEASLPQNGDPVVNSFIKCLLTKKVNERFCTLDQVKQHEFFKDFKWNELIDFTLAAPLIPEVSTSIDYLSSKTPYLIQLYKTSPAKKGSILSSYDDDGKEVYDPNWANQF